MAYRPGEGLEADPEVRLALEAAAGDPELAALRRATELFDQAFAARLAAIPVPPGLQDAILAAAQARQPAPARRATVLRWIHPAAFAVAASVIILLALSFTFWQRPAGPAATASHASIGPDALVRTALDLYASMRPAYRGRPEAEMRQYLASHGGAVPARPPRGFCWSKTYACDVVRTSDTNVTLLCFEAPDKSRSMHLFTFPRSAFPGLEIPEWPQHIERAGEASYATWAEQELIHVLFSDKGEENLRAVLEF